MRWLQRVMDDERLKERVDREKHPLPQDMPPSDMEGLRQYCFQLQCLTARLWDQVWWLSLPWYKRLAFRWLGFQNPIQRFYMKAHEEWLP